MKLKKIIIISTALLALIGIVYYNAVYINPKQIKVRTEYLKNSKLPSSFNDFTIAYFSDLHYGMVDEIFIVNALSEIENMQPDLILFSGDLVDHYSNNPLNDIQRENITAALKELKAPYGKFAVLGNHDLDSENTKNAITNILTDAGFELITNKNIAIYNDVGDFFKLIGIDSMALGNPDLVSAFEGVDDTSFNLSICHTPDIFDQLPSQNDYLLSGHSHGGQVYLSFLTSFYTPYGSKNYYHGKHHRGDMTLDITNGVGMTAKSIRLNADAEVVIYKLSNN